MSAYFSISIFVNIIAKLVQAVKQSEALRHVLKCNVLGEKYVAAQQVFSLFLTEEYKHTGNAKTGL